VPRYLKVAAAQLGAIPEGTTREQMVERMFALMDQAIAEGVDLLAYPELALTPRRTAPRRQTLTLATFILESFTCSI
jgi:predicted amidohydrolase